MKFKKGAYGSGTCADEPWSLQAYQKRVYAVRASSCERSTRTRTRAVERRPELS